jgi:hypothetical protein
MKSGFRRGLSKTYFIGGTYVKVAGTGLELELPLMAALELEKRKKNRNDFTNINKTNRHV